MAKIEVKVPDIGDFKNIPIIEILVKPGDKVKADQSLITLESDKATMDVPSPSAGVVGEIIAKIGDKVSMGSLVLMLDEQGAAAPASAPTPAPSTVAAPAKDALIYRHYWNIGVAVDTPDGLVVAVVKDVDKKGVIELSRELGTLSGKAREGKLSPADMQGATFTISSLGGIGGTHFTPIVNAPEVAILGVVRSKMAPVWDGQAFQPRLMLPLCLSYDHRVIDGAAGARFMRHLATIIEDMRRVLL